MRLFAIFMTMIWSMGVLAQDAWSDTVAWQELKRQIDGSSIIGIGESGHGYETINATKAALMDLLHKEAAIDAISFESSFVGSIVSYCLADTTLDLRTKGFLYPFWNTASVKAVLQPFLTKERDKPLLTGFDIQEDCRFIQFSKVLLERGLILENRQRLLECDSILSFYIGEQYNRKGAMLEAEHSLLIRNYESIATELEAKAQGELQRKFLRQCINNRKWLCNYLALATTNEKMWYRDSLMAENIIWLKTELYRDLRLVVWAASTHVAKRADEKAPRWMGEWLSFSYGDRYVAIKVERGKSETPFLWPNTFYRSLRGLREKFDLKILVARLVKIQPSEWLTPCD